MNATRFFWTNGLWDKAQALAAENLACDEIARNLNLDLDQVIRKFQAESYRQRYDGKMPRRYKHSAMVFLGQQPSLRRRNEAIELHDVFEDRARRFEMRRRQDLTATLFGDPPPRYSALDQKTRAQAS